MAERSTAEVLAVRCTCCVGTGTMLVGDWKSGYPERKCIVCKGSGRMAKDSQGKWGPA